MWFVRILELSQRGWDIHFNCGSVMCKIEMECADLHPDRLEGQNMCRCKNLAVKSLIVLQMTRIVELLGCSPICWLVNIDLSQIISNKKLIISKKNLLISENSLVSRGGSTIITVGIRRDGDGNRCWIWCEQRSQVTRCATCCQPLTQCQMKSCLNADH